MDRASRKHPWLEVKGLRHRCRETGAREVCSASRTRPENAELVSLRIGENNPWTLALSDVDTNGAQREQAFDLVVLIVRTEVKMQSVLYCLCLRDPNEQKSGELVRSGSDFHHIRRLLNYHPSECPLPPPSQEHRIARVDIRLLPFESHKLTLQRTPNPREVR